MKSKKYLENRKAKKIRAQQYAMQVIGLDPGPIYFSECEIKNIIDKIGKELGKTINVEIVENR